MERLRQGPGKEARAATAATPQAPAPARWTLKRIRATFPPLREYTLSGVWRFLRRTLKVKLRSGRVQQFSPDPQYVTKVRRLKKALRATARNPRQVRLVFLDEAGFTRWPDPAPDWVPAAPADRPVAERRGANNHLWRIVAALDAWTGRVTYLDNYIVGRKVLVRMYRRLVETYPRAQRIYVVQDNWSIHTHPEVLAAVEKLPQIKPVWLPTYAPWLNPIEKLWKSLKGDVLKMHRLADAWDELLAKMRSHLEQFQRGSRKLLQYVGLTGEGSLAQALHP